MVDMVWIILRQKEHFLLIQKSTSWTFPGGPIKTNEAPVISAHRELKEAVNVDGMCFRKLGNVTLLVKCCIQVFCCDIWNGEIRQGCIGWFTIMNLYSLGNNLSPFVNESLPYIAYLMQHYAHFPDEWKEQPILMSQYDDQN